ncbi:MAG: hypothetical protein KAS23_02285 [Anaerohalosphaera sp.]|nr:hypothetical protein [Anaerohalosphaera sp.]
MSISFHCERCKKKIVAPDTSGGKWGKCPNCDRKCYIPLPKSEDEEELRLAPIDPEEEARFQRLKMQTFAITTNILQETVLGQDVDTSVVDPISDRDLVKYIVIYLRQMADGELADAEGTEKKIIPHGDQARSILRDMIKSDRPEPELADIAEKVLKGLIKGLNAKIN